MIGARHAAWLVVGAACAIGCGGEAQEITCRYAAGEAREGIASDAFAYVEQALKLRAASSALDETLLGERRALATALGVDTEVSVDEVDAQIAQALRARVRALVALGCTIDYQSDFDPASDAPFGSKPPTVTYDIACAKPAPSAAETVALVRAHLPKILAVAVEARHLAPEAARLCERGRPLLRLKHDNEEMVSFGEAKCAYDDVCSISAGGPLVLAKELVAAAKDGSAPPPAPAAPPPKDAK